MGKKRGRQRGRHIYTEIHRKGERPKLRWGSGREREKDGRREGERETETDRDRDTRRERGSQIQPGKTLESEYWQGWPLAGPGDHQRSAWVLQEKTKRHLLSTTSHLRTIQRNLFHFNILWS